MRGNATSEHFERERLHHVVVGTGCETVELVDILDARGQKDDRAAQMLAHAAAYLETIHAGHVHVQQHDVWGCADRGRRERLGTAVRTCDVVTLHAEVLGEHIRDIDLVIDDQHAHGALPHLRPDLTSGHHLIISLPPFSSISVYDLSIWIKRHSTVWGTGQFRFDQNNKLLDALLLALFYTYLPAVF